MRIIATTALAYVMIGGIAVAADLRPPQPAFAPPVPAMPAWTGFYLGLNAGGGFGTADSDFSASPGPTFASVDLSLKGAIGGGQIGYNWQSDAMVFAWRRTSRPRRSKATSARPAFPALRPAARRATTRSFRGWNRAQPHRHAQAGWLLYATGGYAVGRVETDATATAGPLTAILSTSDTRSGWTVGGGAEVLLAPRWSIKVEYLYVDLGRATHSYAFAGLPTLNDTTHVSFNVFRAGANYRF
jgi:outer membrane immunogenic protein